MFSLFSNSLPQIRADDVKRSLDHKENVTVLDVGTQEEYQEGHLKGSVLLPITDVREKVTKVLPRKDQTMYVLCRSGARSAKAISEMKQLGYTNVYNRQTAIIAWRNKGFPIAI